MEDVLATAEQIKALLKSHVERDEQRFLSVALQVAAKEARSGHHKLAREIKELVEKAQAEQKVAPVAKLSSIARKPTGDLEGLLEVSHPSVKKAELILRPEIRRSDGTNLPVSQRLLKRLRYTLTEDGLDVRISTASGSETATKPAHGD